MSFLNPLMLVGLLAAAIPIVIHLIHKRRPRSQDFPAIELVLRSVERVERRWRVRRFLLLLARVLLIAALCLAAAGPLLGERAELSTKTGGPERLAIVIDASLSMRASYDGTSAFSRALVAARNLVDGMGPEDQATIVLGAQPAQVLLPEPTPDRPTLLARLDALEPTFGPTELGAAVTLAAQALGSSEAETPEPGAEGLPEVSARVVVLSDLAQSSLQSAADLAVPGTSSRARLEVLDVLTEVEGPRLNRGLVRVESKNVPGGAPHTVELLARVQSFATGTGGAPEPADITLRSSERDLFTGAVDVVPGTIVDKAIRHSFDGPGYQAVQVVLEPDALVEDDVRHVMVEVRRQVRTLIVDGAPSGVPKEDEIFYLERALLAGASDQPPPRVITVDDLTRADLSAYEVVILAGVDAFSRRDGARLVEFVRGGGGLMITTSEDLDVTLYNAELGPILPRELRGLKVVDAERGGVGSGGVVGLAEPDLEHPVLRIFRGDGLRGLLSTQTQAYLLLQPGRDREMEVLLRHSDGQPALVSAQAERGRIAVLTTSVDRDLSDLPIRPAFVPLMRQVLLHLGDALATPDQRATLVGDRRDLRLPAGVRAVRVTAPDGAEQTYAEAEVKGGAVRYEATALPGAYRVEAAFAGDLEPLRSEDFTVNVDPRESDLRPYGADEARAILLGAADPSDSEVTAAERAALLSAGVSPEQLARLLLLVMVVAFLVESALTAARVGR